MAEMRPVKPIGSDEQYTKLMGMYASGLARGMFRETPAEHEVMRAADWINSLIEYRINREVEQRLDEYRLIEKITRGKE